MGIINVTPDSFSGDGLRSDLGAIVALAKRMVEEGADILDVGGESTRPGSQAVDEAEELARVAPAISAIRAELDVPISVDTRKPNVATAAFAAGANAINDVGGLQSNPIMAAVVAEFGGGIIAMHSPGVPWEVPWPATYTDVISDVRHFLDRSIQLARRAGIDRDQIVVDPGFGFGKSVANNLTLLRRLGELRDLGQPILIGTSRKQTIGRVLNLPVEDRLEGSLATVALAIGQGVDIVRVHDVKASARVAKMADAVVR
jgi:dihydropteroate synthase